MRTEKKLLTWLHSQQPYISSFSLKLSRMAISEHMAHCPWRRGGGCQMETNSWLGNRAQLASCLQLAGGL